MSSSTYKRHFLPWAPTLTDLGGAVLVDPAVACRQLLNMTPTDAGTTEKRGGLRKFLGLNSLECQRAAGMFSGRFKSMPGMDFVVVSADSIYPLGVRRQVHFVFGSGFTYATPDTSGNQESSTYESKYGTTPDYVVIGDKLFIASPGVGLLSVQFSGAKGNLWRQERGIPAAHYVSSQGGRLWIGRTDGYEDSVFASVPGDPENFQFSEGAVRIGVSDRSGRPITGLSGAFYGSVYAFTEDSISRVRAGGPTDLEREQVSDTIGAASNPSIIQVNNDLVFASTKGLHSLVTTQKYGDVESRFLSAPIQALWNRLDPESIRQATATYYAKKNLYLLCIRDTARALGGEYDTKILVLHVPSARWAVWDVQAEALCISSHWGWGQPIPLVAAGSKIGASSGIYGIDCPDRVDFNYVSNGRTVWVADGGKGYSSIATTEWIDCGDPSANKNFRRVDLTFESGASALGSLRWLVDDQFNAADADVRGMEEATFYLNPAGENVIGIGTAAGSGLADADNTFLSRPYDTPCVVSVPIYGSGRRIKLEIEADGGVDGSNRPTGGYPFNLLGFTLHYIVESEAFGGARLDRKTDVPHSVFSYGNPLALPVTIGAGDEAEVP